MADGCFRELSLTDSRDKHVVVFFSYLDFTFVCPSKMIAFSDRIAKFEERNVPPLGVSDDSQ